MRDFSVTLVIRANDRGEADDIASVISEHAQRYLDLVTHATVRQSCDAARLFDRWAKETT